MIENFIDPYTGFPLSKDSEGNLYFKKEDKKILYKNYDGCYDFVVADEGTQLERDYYDKQYLPTELKPLYPDDIRRQWFDEMNPWRITLLRSLGDLAGKSVLLVGNGETTREIYFTMAGANVIFTDLSLEAVIRRKKQIERSQLMQNYYGTIEFHAVDAVHLPFPDNAFDIIYGAAFVHHLEDLDKFLKEVYRCLKVNGICRFLDQAHSRIWKILSQSVLWPLKKYSYWRNPRSPADIKADQRGGFTEEGLNLMMRKHGFSDVLFKREWFFFRIVSRHYGKFFKYNSKAMARAKYLFRFMKWIDLKIMNTSFMRKNGLMLTWGFSK